MSVPAEEMRRRVPVARPTAQQLALPPPAPAAVPQPGTPPTTVVPPRADTVTVDPAGRASVANVRAPGAATALQQPPRPTMFVTPGGVATPEPNVARSIATRDRVAAGRAAPAAAAPPRGVPAAQVQFAPNPRTTTELPGRAPAAAAMGAPPPAAAAAGPAQPPRAAAAPAAGPQRAPSRGMRSAGVIGAGLETLNVIGAGREGGARAAAEETGAAATRLGLAAGGAKLGGTLGPLGAAVGGLLGYAGGAQLVDQMRNPDSSLNRAMSQYGTQRAVPIGASGAMFMAPSQIAAGQAAGIQPGAMPAAAQLAEAPPPSPDRPDFSRVVSGASSVPAAPAGRQSLGFFEGERTGRREVFAGEPVERSPNAGGSFNTIPAYTGTGAAAQLAAAPSGPRLIMPRDSSRQTIEMIDKAISQIGPLDRRGRRQAVADLLGLRSRAESGDMDRTSIEGRSAAELAQRDAATRLAAEVDREQIAATSANARRQNTQTVTGADGTVYAIDGTQVAPLTMPDGTALRTSQRQDTQLQSLAAELLQQSMASGMVEDPNAAAAQAAQAARALQANLGAQPGMTYIGTQNGKPVYQDAQGNRFVDE